MASYDAGMEGPRDPAPPHPLLLARAEETMRRFQKPHDGDTLHTLCSPPIKVQGTHVDDGQLYRQTEWLILREQLVAGVVSRR